MKTFYIAGRSKHADTVQKIAQVLMGHGYEWSFNWTIQSVPPKPLPLRDSSIATFAQNCLDGIKTTDLFILLAKDSHGARGMFIELGYALAHSATIWIINDEDPSVFSCISTINHATSIEDFFKQTGFSHDESLEVND